MRQFRIIFCCLFFVILAVPLVGMLWYEEPETTENKELAEAPSLTEDSHFNINYLADLEVFFSDHFAYRQELVTANAVMNSEIFAQSSEDLAIVGTDDWLYLKVTLDDYMGTNCMSDRGIHNLLTVLTLMQEYAESQGKEFVFACAPNKNTLYPDHMPYYYTQTDKDTNLTRLTELLADSNVNYVDLVGLFESEDEVLYHKGDSHWNNKGAALVAYALLGKTSVSYTDFTQCETTIRNDFEGDIDKILFPQNQHTESEYDYSPYFDYTYTDTDDVTASTVLTEQTDGNGKSLLCFRDSFGNTLLPFLAQDFDRAKFCKAVPYRIDDLYKEDRDVCVVELVERNLIHLIKFAPVMPAALRSFDNAVTEVSSETVRYEQTEFEDYLKFSGIADASYVEDESPIYLRFTSDSGVYVIEATPADESELSGTPSDYGYTAYIGKQAFPAGSYQVELLTEQAGTWYSVTVDSTCEIGN